MMVGGVPVKLLLWIRDVDPAPVCCLHRNATLVVWFPIPLI